MNLAAILLVLFPVGYSLTQDGQKHWGRQAGATVESASVVPADPLPKILSTMMSNNKSLKSLVLEVAAEEKRYYGGDTQYTLKIKVMMLPDGKWYARCDQFDKENRALETLIAKDDKFDSLNHQTRVATRSQMNGNFVKADMEKLCGVCFPILPLLSDNKEQLDRHFSTSIVQADKHYTWIRFVPKTAVKQRDITVAQIGVVNYENDISPAHYPLYVAWRGPSGNEVIWRIIRVACNDASLVHESDFTIELREYERKGWKIERDDRFVLWKAVIGLFTEEPEVPKWVDERLEEKEKLKKKADRTAGGK